MQPPPKGDTPFSIDAPANGSVLGPTFSVNGSHPPNMTNIKATVGTTTVNAVQQANDTWEAIFTNMPSGIYAVSASSSGGNATPGGITITVVADPCPPPPPPCPCEWPWEEWPSE